jgi:hypothetical protein
VAAVLEHADELALTDAQKQTLQQLDDALAEKNDALKAEAHKRREAGSGGGDNPAPMMGGRGMRGGGRGMRGAGMRHDAPEPEALTNKLDDNDTQTYLEAEKTLTEAQRPRARELASRYREALYNSRATRQSP